MKIRIIALISIIMMVASGVWISDYADAQTKSDIDVFILAGQSNAAYTFRANPSEVDTVCSPGIAYYFGSETSPVAYDQWDSSADYGIYDMVNSNHSAHIGGIELPFATEYYRLTGHKICIINVAVSGSKIAQWGFGAECYEWAKEVFAKAMDKLDDDFTPHVKSLLWMQGESNPTWQIEAYKNRLNNLIDAMSQTSAIENFNDDYAIDSCVISLTRQYRGVNTCIAQIQMAAEQDNVALGCITTDTFNYSNGLLYNDNTHYTQKGRNIVGKDMAQSFVKWFY